MKQPSMNIIFSILGGFMAVQYWITSGNHRSHNAVDTALRGVRPGLSPGSATYHYVTLDKLPKVPGMGQVKTANHQKV